MSAQLNVSIKLFGGLRNFFDGQEVIIPVKQAASVQEIKDKLLARIKSEHQNTSGIDIIHQSVLADDKRILDNHELITADTSLAILPPVCGG